MENKLKHLCILYADDDEIIRQQAGLYLEKHCKKIYLACDGKEALELFEDFNPDIVISDIQMPRLDGLELARAIRKKDKQTPIILATAFTDTPYLLEAVELQLIKYLVKPISSQQLLKALYLAKESIEGDMRVVLLSNGYRYDKLNRTLFCENRLIPLTTKEQLLLDILLRDLGSVVPYQKIESYVWLDKFVSMDSLRSLVKKLRRKLEGVTIENLSGVGYKIILPDLKS